MVCGSRKTICFFDSAITTAKMPVGGEVQVVRILHFDGLAEGAVDRIDWCQAIAGVVVDPQGPQVPRRHHVLWSIADPLRADHPQRDGVDDRDRAAAEVRHVDQRLVMADPRRDTSRPVAGRTGRPRRAAVACRAAGRSAGEARRAPSLCRPARASAVAPPHSGARSVLCCTRLPTARPPAPSWHKSAASRDQLRYGDRLEAAVAQAAQ